MTTAAPTQKKPAGAKRASQSGQVCCKAAKRIENLIVFKRRKIVFDELKRRLETNDYLQKVLLRGLNYP